MDIRLDVSDRAKDDLDEIVFTIATENGKTVAQEWLLRLRHAIFMLRDFPELGVRKTRLGRLVRRIVERPYVIYYTFDGTTVRISRVLHGRRKVTRKLLKET